jgi:hypothetical protein
MQQTDVPDYLKHVEVSIPVLEMIIKLNCSEEWIFQLISKVYQFSKMCLAEVHLLSLFFSLFRLGFMRRMRDACSTWMEARGNHWWLLLRNSFSAVILLQFWRR